MSEKVSLKTNIKEGVKKNKQEKKESPITISAKIANGVYANFNAVTHTNADVVLDFIHLVPGAAKAKVKARVIIAPSTAKNLIKDLEEALENYEKQYNDSTSSAIATTKKEIVSYPLNFGNIEGQA